MQEIIMIPYVVDDEPADKFEFATNEDDAKTLIYCYMKQCDSVYEIKLISEGKTIIVSREILEDDYFDEAIEGLFNAESC